MPCNKSHLLVALTKRLNVYTSYTVMRLEILGSLPVLSRERHDVWTCFTCKFWSVDQIEMEAFLDKDSDVLPVVSLVDNSGLRSYVTLILLFNKKWL